MNITKTMTFDMAHRLVGHKGKCKNLHGHTFQLEVTVSNRNGELDDMSMVMDFSDLKAAWQKIEEQFDHICMLERCLDNRSLIAALIDTGVKVNIVSFSPTSENLAPHIADLLNKELPKDVYVSHIRLWETPTSYVDYDGE